MTDFTQGLEALLLDASKHHREGNPDESRQTLMRALDLIDATVGRSSPLAVSGILRVAAGLYTLAPLERNQLSFELEQQAHELAKRLPESDPCVRRALSQFGGTLSVWGRHEEAAAMLEHCIRLSDTHGSNPKALALHLNDLALILMQLDRHDEALPLLQRARTVISDPEATLHRASTTLLGGIFVKLSRFPEALELLEPIQRRRIARFGQAPKDEMTEWFNEAQRAVHRPPRKKPTSRTKQPKKRR